MPFGRTARELGYEPVLISGPAPLAALERWRTVYAEVRVLPDPYAAATLAAAAVELAGGRPPAALFSCYDGLVLPAATAAAQLGLPHPALGGLLRSRHKDLTREATAAAGLATPRFARIGSPADCTAAAAAVGFPAIVKPLNGMASHLVLRVHDEAELRAAYERLAIGVQRSFRGNYSQVEGADPSTTFLVEELLEGPEYSAEVIVRGGRIERVALFEKFLIDPRGFLERGFTSPPLRADRAEPLWAHVEACLRALGVDDAACHVELVDTARGPVLIENNAGRAGGQILVRAVRESRGIDLIAEIVALQCGLPAPARQAPALSGRVTTLTVFPPASGRLTALRGLDDVRALAGVVDVLPFCAPGDLIDVDDKEFFAVNLLVSGLEPEALRALADRAAELVRFELEPAAREPAGDGPLRPSATLAELRSAGADRRVRVAGRLLHAAGDEAAEDGVWLLADGDASVQRALRVRRADAAVAGLGAARCALERRRAVAGAGPSGLRGQRRLGHGRGCGGRVAGSGPCHRPNAVAAGDRAQPVDSLPARGARPARIPRSADAVSARRRRSGARRPTRDALGRRRAALPAHRPRGVPQALPDRRPGRGLRAVRQRARRAARRDPPARVHLAGVLPPFLDPRRRDRPVRRTGPRRARAVR